ncbi:MAG: hypothetical protein Q4P24_11820 [Rhodobacterales bacterium]|nr:hypothetical protein [Rhodobacterales bacterium]
MTQFDLNAFVAHADTASMPTHSHGLVYEPWQQERTDKARDLIAALVPADQQDAAEAALRAKCIIEDDWMPGEGECMHGLDASTCPCGCFEHEVSLADMEDGAFPEWVEAELAALEEDHQADLAAQEEQEAERAARAAAQEATESKTGETEQGHDRRRWTMIALGCLVLALALYVLA